MRVNQLVRFTAAILSLLLIAMAFSGCAKEQSTPITDEAYTFPVKPGTDEWKALGSHDQMLAVCEIPENILTIMSTTALVETVLNYPLIGDWFAYDNPQTGLDYSIKQFNGLSELLSRADAGSALLAKYSMVDPAEVASLPATTEQADFWFEGMTLELLLSQGRVISGMSSNEIQALISRARAVYQIKSNYINFYSRFDLDITTSLIAKASQTVQ
jgi:hypothetical protein